MKQQKLNEDMSAEKNQKNFTVLNTWVTTYIQEYNLIMWTEHKKTAKTCTYIQARGAARY